MMVYAHKCVCLFAHRWSFLLSWLAILRGDVTIQRSSTTWRPGDRGHRASPSTRWPPPTERPQRPSAASRARSSEHSSLARWVHLGCCRTTPRGTRWRGCRRRQETWLHRPSCCHRCLRTRCACISVLSTSDARHTAPQLLMCLKSQMLGYQVHH